MVGGAYQRVLPADVLICGVHGIDATTAVPNTEFVRSVIVLGYPGVQALDLVGPFEVFTGATIYLASQGRADEGYKVSVVSRGGEPATTLTGLALVAQPLPDPRHPIDTLTACVSVDDVLAVRRRAFGVRMSDELKRYVVDVVRETRAATGVQLGASPRASLALMKAAQALALTEGREFVIPEDVREMAVPVIAHRMVAEPQARFGGVTTAGIVEEILAKVPPPS